MKKSNDLKWNKIQELEDVLYMYVFHFHYNSNTEWSNLKKLVNIKTWVLANKVYDLMYTDLNRNIKIDHNIQIDSFSCSSIHWSQVITDINYCFYLSNKSYDYYQYLNYKWEYYEWVNS